MKKLKDCELLVKIKYGRPIKKKVPFWSIENSADFGACCVLSNGDFINDADAKADFIKFAKLNGIKNYKFI